MKTLPCYHMQKKLWCLCYSRLLKVLTLQVDSPVLLVICSPFADVLPLRRRALMLTILLEDKELITKTCGWFCSDWALFLLLSLRFRTDKTFIAVVALSRRKNICCCRFAFAQIKHLPLTLRFRAEKTLLLSLHFRTEQSFLVASDEPLGPTDVFCAKA